MKKQEILNWTLNELGLDEETAKEMILEEKRRRGNNKSYS